MIVSTEQYIVVTELSTKGGIWHILGLYDIRCRRMTFKVRGRTWSAYHQYHSQAAAYWASASVRALGRHCVLYVPVGGVVRYMVARRGLRRMKLDRTEMSTTGWTTLIEKKNV